MTGGCDSDLREASATIFDLKSEVDDRGARVEILALERRLQHGQPQLVLNAVENVDARGLGFAERGLLFVDVNDQSDSEPLHLAPKESTFTLLPPCARHRRGRGAPGAATSTPGQPFPAKYASPRGV